jgi:hypothetical protein
MNAIANANATFCERVQVCLWTHINLLKFPYLLFKNKWSTSSRVELFKFTLNCWHYAHLFCTPSLVKSQNRNAAAIACCCACLAYEWGLVTRFPLFLLSEKAKQKKLTKEIFQSHPFSSPSPQVKEFGSFFLVGFLPLLHSLH